MYRPYIWINIHIHTFTHRPNADRNIIHVRPMDVTWAYWNNKKRDRKGVDEPFVFFPRLWTSWSVSDFFCFSFFSIYQYDAEIIEFVFACWCECFEVLFRVCKFLTFIMYCDGGNWSVTYEYNVLKGFNYECEEFYFLGNFAHFHWIKNKFELKTERPRDIENPNESWILCSYSVFVNNTSPYAYCYVPVVTVSSS